MPDLYKMKLNEEVKDKFWSIRRVPGGWLYYKQHNGEGIVFVPYDNEFQENASPKINQKKRDRELLVETLFSRLQRYRLQLTEECNGGEMVPSTAGGWVGASDVKNLLKEILESK